MSAELVSEPTDSDGLSSWFGRPARDCARTQENPLPAARLEPDTAKSAQEIADYLLSITLADPDHHVTITTLQMWLYYAQGHYLATTGEPLFEDEILTPMRDFRRAKPMVAAIEKKYRRHSEFVRRLTGKYPSLKPSRRVDLTEKLPYGQGAFLRRLVRIYADYNPHFLNYRFRPVGTGHRNDGGTDHPADWKRYLPSGDVVTHDELRANFPPLAWQ